MSVYNGKDMSDLGNLVTQTAMQLAKYTYEFDIIAVRGLSGQLVGIPVSLIMRKELIIVRKRDERAHSVQNPGMREAGQNGRYIIIDDFMSSGDTVAAIRHKIRAERPDLQLTGLYMYETDKWLEPTTI